MMITDSSLWKVVYRKTDEQTVVERSLPTRLTFIVHCSIENTLFGDWR